MNITGKSIVSIILVVSTIAIGYFLLIPRWAAYKESQLALTAENEEHVKLEAAQADLNNYLSVYRAHASDAKALNQALPLSNTNFHNVLNSLELLTKQTGMTLAGLSIDTTPESDSLGAVPNTIRPIDLSIQVEGGYTPFKTFLGRLESNLRIMDISSISIQTGSTANSMNFSLKFRTYYQK